jgi:hypothetical protein
VPKCSVERVVDHIEYIAKTAGPDHVGDRRVAEVMKPQGPELCGRLLRLFAVVPGFEDGLRRIRERLAEPRSHVAQGPLSLRAHEQPRPGLLEPFNRPENQRGEVRLTAVTTRGEMKPLLKHLFTPGFAANPARAGDKDWFGEVGGRSAACSVVTTFTPGIPGVVNQAEMPPGAPLWAASTLGCPSCALDERCQGLDRTALGR